jgi:hypothetical protein
MINKLGKSPRPHRGLFLWIKSFISEYYVGNVDKNSLNCG